MISVLAEKPMPALERFLMDLARAGVRTDVAKIGRIALETINHLKRKKSQRHLSQDNQVLEERWYKSLEAITPDYTVYAEDSYLGELWACWEVYSKQYLKAISKPSSLSPIGVLGDLCRVQSIVDLGCGFGYTTAGLRELFPNATIRATNFVGTVQALIADKMGSRYRFELHRDTSSIDRCDLIFASEYFEHIPAPVEHLRKILRLKPMALLVANSFNTRAIGHFLTYEVDGQQMDGRATSRVFNQALRDAGYSEVKTKLWNKRPAYWKLR